MPSIRISIAQINTTVGDLEANQSKIISYIENISIKSDIDIILTEEQYFMSSKKIDISNQIINLLNENIILLNIIDE